MQKPLMPSPATVIKSRKRGPIDSLTVIEVDKMLAFVQELPHIKHSKRNRLILLLGIDGGFRLSEILGVQIGDVWKHGQVVNAIQISDQVAKYGSGRTIDLTARLRIALEKWLFEFPGRYEDQDDPLFPGLTKRSNRLSRRQVQNIVSQISKLAIDKHVTPHQLRHHAATRLLKVTNLRVVQQFLGHRHISTTQIYTHPDRVDLKKALETRRTNDLADGCPY